MINCNSKFEIASSIRGNKMTIEDCFRQRYNQGTLLWDVGKPDFTGSLTMFAKCQKRDPNMMRKRLAHFHHPGRQNTMEVVQGISKKSPRAWNRTCSGCFEFNRKNGRSRPGRGFQGTKIELVCVSSHAGSSGGDEIRLDEDTKKEMENKGIKTLSVLYAPLGVSRSITGKFGGTSRVEHHRRGEALRIRWNKGGGGDLNHGAVDARLLLTDREIIAAGGKLRCGCRTRFKGSTK